MLTAKRKYWDIIHIYCLIYLILGLVYISTQIAQIVYRPWLAEEWFVYLTHWTFILSILYVASLMKNKSKKANSVLGILTSSNYLIVNLAAWCFFSAKRDPFEGDTLWIISNCFEHFVFFVLTTFLWLFTMQKKHISFYLTDIQKKNIIPYMFIILTVFVILQAVYVFNRVTYMKVGDTWQWCYFSAYFQITNWNPDNGGNLYCLFFVPFAYIIYAFFTLLYFKLFKFNFQTKINKIDNKMIRSTNIYTYFYTIILLAENWLYYSGILGEKAIYIKILLSFCLIFFVVSILVSLIFLYRSIKMKNETMVDTYMVLIFMFSILDLIGKILTVWFVFFGDEFFGIQIKTFSLICSGYSIINILLLIGMFMYCNSVELSNIKDIWKKQKPNN